MLPSVLEPDRISVASKVSVREARLSDYAAVMPLMQRYGMKTKSRVDWEHLWTGNPLYHRLEGKWPIGWVLENETGAVVGFVGNIPLAYELSRKPLTVAATCAWVVDSQYRRYSMLLASKYFAQKQVDLLLNTTATYEAGHIFRAFHAKPVPVEALNSSLFWVTAYRGFARSTLLRKAIPFPALCSYPVAALLAIAGQIKRMRPGRSLPGLITLDSFGEQFDRFWMRLRQSTASLLAVRDRANLEWHFRETLRSGLLWIYAFEVDGDVTSYALFQREDKPEVGLTRIRLVDFQSLDPNPLILHSAIAAAQQRCAAEGIHMLEVLGFAGPVRSALESSAPFRRSFPSPLYYYKAGSPELKFPLAEPQAWQLCGYDGDSSL